MKEKGFTYLGCVDGESIFCNLSNEESIKSALEFLGKLTGEEWDFVQESYGLCNIVFYKKSMFKVFGASIRFCGKNKVELPLNCSSCYKMFANISFDLSFDFSNFDTSNVVSMYTMFYGCKFSDDFCLNLNTSRVEDMDNMFSRTEFGKNFCLGDEFCTSSVESMANMFAYTKISEGFSLGDKFDTSKVEVMYNMFTNAELPEGFSLGDKFCTSNVVDMSGMFSQISLPVGFRLGDKFDTRSVEDAAEMFYGCFFNDDFVLPSNFVLASDAKTDDMFGWCNLPHSMTIRSFTEVTDTIQALKRL